MRPISDAEARRREALRVALQRRRPTITQEEKRRVSQNPTTNGARSSAVLNATRYANQVIQALRQKL